MPLPLNPAMAATAQPPVMEARRWLQAASFPPDRPLINVSQAAPTAPPPHRLRQAIAEAALTDDTAHLYGPVLGLPALRAALAQHCAASYGGIITPSQIAITQGCNQAFAAVIATLAGPGDEVILPTPWYFNHKMWLDMASIRAIPLDTGRDLLPSPDAAARQITDKTRAIVLVTPNNPGGVEYPAALLRAFCDLARAHKIALVLDETYRDFDSRSGPPHDLFHDADWPDSLIQLYSFSKAYRLTGHRVGAVTASADRLAEVEKFLDTVAICTNQLGQIAALWGLQNLGPWLATQRRDILARRDAMIAGFSALPDWKLLGCGAYFAYVEHPFPMDADQLCQRLVHEASLLVLPGSMFHPPGAAAGQRQLRIAFANVDLAGIEALFSRLAAFRP